LVEHENSIKENKKCGKENGGHKSINGK